MIDEQTRRDLDTVRELAQHNGHNLWEELDRIGLLNTPHRRQQLAVAAIDALYRRLPEEPGPILDWHWGLERRGTHTPSTTYQAVLAYIEQALESAARGEPDVDPAAFTP